MTGCRMLRRKSNRHAVSGLGCRVQPSTRITCPARLDVIGSRYTQRYSSSGIYAAPQHRDATLPFEPETSEPEPDHAYPRGPSSWRPLFCEPGCFGTAVTSMKTQNGNNFSFLGFCSWLFILKWQSVHAVTMQRRNGNTSQQANTRLYT